MASSAKSHLKDALHKVAVKVEERTSRKDNQDTAAGEAGTRDQTHVHGLGLTDSTANHKSLTPAPPPNQDENATATADGEEHSENADGTIEVKQFSQWTLPGDESSEAVPDNQSAQATTSNSDTLPAARQDSIKPHEQQHTSQSSSSTSMWGSSQPNSAASKEPDMAGKYVLRVSAGPSYDRSTHVPVPVNSRSPVHLSSKSMDVLLYVRIRDFDGLPRHAPASQSSSPYFDAPSRKNDQYSVAFSFVPKRDINADRLVWGNDFDHPVRERLPPGFNTAFRIVKDFIDPGLECDAHADEPWLYGPALSCWFAMDVGPKISEDASSKPKWPESVKDGTKPLEEGDEEGIREALSIPSAAQKRRKHFLKQGNRQAFTFERGRLYSADFYNPYLDFGKSALKLPGFSLSVLRYIGDKTHTLRYVFKELSGNGSPSRQDGEVFFVVELTLLFGEDAAKGIEEDRQRGQQNGAGGGEDELD